MSHLVSRILYTIVMIPLALLLDRIAMDAFSQPLSHVFRHWETSVWANNILIAIFLTIAWMWLWGRAVKWTMSRVASTLTALFASAAAAAGIYARIARLGFGETAIIVGVLSVPIFWMTTTILLWRDPAYETRSRK